MYRDIERHAPANGGSFMVLNREESAGDSFKWICSAPTPLGVSLRTSGRWSDAHLTLRRGDDALREGESAKQNDAIDQLRANTSSSTQTHKWT